MTTPELTRYDQLSQELSTLLIQYHRQPTRRVRQSIETTVRTIKALFPFVWTRSAVELICMRTFGNISVEFGTITTNYLLTL